MTAVELIQALKDAQVELSLAHVRQTAAQQWLKLMDDKVHEAYNKSHAAMKAIEEFTKAPVIYATVGDIWKAYGVHSSQLVDGLPVVDPRTVTPIAQEEQ